MERSGPNLCSQPKQVFSRYVSGHKWKEVDRGGWNWTKWEQDEWNWTKWE